MRIWQNLEFFEKKINLSDNCFQRTCRYVRQKKNLKKKKKIKKNKTNKTNNAPSGTILSRNEIEVLMYAFSHHHCIRIVLETLTANTLTSTEAATTLLKNVRGGERILGFLAKRPLKSQSLVL